jgi:hypothetical protein
MYSLQSQIADEGSFISAAKIKQEVSLEMSK